MKNNLQKLELTWIGKGQEPKLEPRILIEDPSKSFGDQTSENMLINGDNLLALKALEQNFAGKIQCIFIDPPYNTGQAFEFYDDGIETSLWLSLMKERLLLLSRLLKKNGVIFVQIDDKYFAHLRLLLDEVFGHNQYINTIAVKSKESSGASGGGEDRRLKKNIEFLICYGGREFDSFNDVYKEVELEKYLEMMRLEEKSFKYTSVLTKIENKEFIKTIKDGSGKDMNLYKVLQYETKSLSRLAKEERISEVEVIYKYYDRVHTTENAQTSIRTRVQEATDNEDNMYALEYFPISGRNKGKSTELLFVGPQKRLVSWFKNVTYKKGSKILKREKLGTFWDNLNWNNVTREGGVRFPNGQKPEKLISICLELSTKEGDYVLDSFLGSGTTSAVAHKMKRKWIGIELGEHANTHALVRLKSVVSGEDQSGITSESGWKSGGGFKFYTLAPSLLQKDKYGSEIINTEYNPNMLAAAMAKQEGFHYLPDINIYWKQGNSSEKDFIYTTTQFITTEILDRLAEEMQPGESLLICCKSYSKSCERRYGNITIKKIPQMLLGRCEFGKDDYSLNIVNLSHEDVELDDISIPTIETSLQLKPSKKTSDNNQSSLF
jgi:adenine-specific DNA-methyltransferase